MDVRVWYKFREPEPDRWTVAEKVFDLIRRLSGGKNQKVTNSRMSFFSYEDSNVTVEIEAINRDGILMFRIITDGFKNHQGLKFLYMLEGLDGELVKWSERPASGWYDDISPTTMCKALNVREDKFVEYWMDEIEPLL